MELERKSQNGKVFQDLSVTTTDAVMTTKFLCLIAVFTLPVLVVNVEKTKHKIYHLKSTYAGIR